MFGALQSDESGHLDRQMASFLHQVVIDAEATEVGQAERHDRTHSHTTKRNGRRTRLLSTSVRDVELKIPVCESVKGQLLRSIIGGISGIHARRPSALCSYIERGSRSPRILDRRTQGRELSDSSRDYGQGDSGRNGRS